MPQDRAATGDCIETLEEIDMEAREAFTRAGGERFEYIACLNDRPEWIRALADIAERHLQGWPTRDVTDAKDLQETKFKAMARDARA